MSKEFRPDTICVQTGWKPKKGEPRVLPIYQSTTFKYDTTEEMGRLFALEEDGYFYSRLQNPNTKAVVGETIANPALTILDIEKFAKLAHAHGIKHLSPRQPHSL